MHAIEQIQTDTYEDCLHQAINYSENSRHIGRSLLLTLADGMLKLSGQARTHHALEGIKTLLLDCYSKYWRQLSNSLNSEHIDTLPMTKRDSSIMHELLNDRTRIVAALKPYSKQLAQLSTAKQRILQQLKLCEDPTIYYNLVEQERCFAELGRLHEGYSQERPRYQEIVRTVNKLLGELALANKKLCLEGEQTLHRSNSSMGQTIRLLEERYSHFLLAVATELHGMIVRLQQSDVESSIAIDKEEFRRGYLHHFARTKIMSSQEAAAMQIRTVKVVRGVVDALMDRSRRLNDCLQEFFQQSNEGLAQLSHQLKNNLQELQKVRLQVNMDKLCPNGRLLQRSLRSTELIFSQFFQLSRDTLKVSAFELKQLASRNRTRLQGAISKLNLILETLRQQDSRQLLEFHQQIYQQLGVLQQLQNSDNRQFRHIMVRLLEKHRENVERSCSKLKDNVKSAPSVNIFEYIRNEMLADILTQPLVWDHNFDRRAADALNHRLQLSNDQDISAGGDGSYSCALGGKLLLSGRLKICDGTLCFESSFNKRNLFFGGTKLIVPRSHLLGARAQTMMMLDNSIEVLTKMGPLFFTSLFYRQQTLKEFEDMLSTTPVLTSDSAKDETDSIRSEKLSDEQLRIVFDKEAAIDPSFLEPLEVQTSKFTFASTNLKTFYRLILSNNETRSRGKTYSSFRTLCLNETGNSQIKIGRLEPEPPQYFEKQSQVKLSQAQPSERTVTYKRKLPSLPIPFMPTHSNCKEVQKIHWLSPRQIIVEKENSATGVPFADSLLVRLRMHLIELTDTNSVECSLSYVIMFKPGASLQGILRSAAEAQIKAFQEFFLKETDSYLAEVRARPKTRRSRRTVQQAAADMRHSEQSEQLTAKPPLADRRIQLIIAAALLALLFLIVGQLIQ